jgi:hypothetical protein
VEEMQILRWQWTEWTRTPGQKSELVKIVKRKGRSTAAASLSVRRREVCEA